jgi:prepilin-type N-terminal cleavage/methylation domain-containing protein
MMKRFFTKNEGYSLVEMIIVIAIVLVLATGALLSYSVVHSARAKEGAIKVGAEFNELKNRCMNMAPDDSSHDFYALSMYNDDQDVTHLTLVSHKKTGGFDDVPDTDVMLSSSVRVMFDQGSYYEADGTTKVDVSSETAPGSKSSPIYICFDKRGNCYSGYGDYKFFKNRGNQVARVNVKQNGGIDVR